ncbi:Protein of unknown function [Pyronema omphalodes CBS 100304]|uniref:Uncharacterized protein n=1 Tax=Pyronema omphalodes (strain CBS 100304) TaxID=1076935 RepID=U4LHU7_PYROM|nr:Protein of unknown function [Pyronema omphalodes CBS 100304]
MLCCRGKEPSPSQEQHSKRRYARLSENVLEHRYHIHSFGDRQPRPPIESCEIKWGTTPVRFDGGTTLLVEILAIGLMVRWNDARP